MLSPCSGVGQDVPQGAPGGLKMVPLDYVLAAVLLTTAPLTTDTPPDEGGRELLAPLRALALHWEVMDPREIGHLLTRPEDLPADLQLLRRRWATLADAPPA